MRTRRRFDGFLIFGVVTVTVLAAARIAPAQQPAQTTAQAAMRGVFVVLSSVYGYSLDEKAFADPANRLEILGKLEALANNANQLEAHGGGLDPSFDFMRRSLARDAHDAFVNFKSHNYMGARFVLSKITENCVTCHTKLPAEREFDLGRKFIDSIDTRTLPPTAVANLQIATRQFSDAMKTYEGILSSRDVKAEDLAISDVFENYLRLSIGAMNDTKRPARALQEFVRRPDMPDAMKADVRDWIVSLEALKLDVPVDRELAAARNMVAEAEKKTVSRSDRSRLVDFVGSVTLLHRYLRSKPGSDVDLAESYYLLGVAESRISRSYWLSETDYLLEKSIRTAPKSAVARQALAFLEDYRRSAAVPARPVPPELQTNIEDLRKLTGQ